MPDIQTALRSALSKTLQVRDDDGEEGTPVPVPASVQPVSTSVSAPSQNIQGIPMTKPTINQHKITNNVSRVTFNYVRDNPGSTRQEIIKELGYQGFTKGSVSSLLAQMRRAGMAHDTGGLWYADIQEYAPIKNLNYKKRPVAQTKKTAPTPVAKPTPAPVAKPAGLAALHADTEPPVRKSFLTKLVRTQAPEEVIGNMTVYQARDLYLHLKQMFGG